jgi:hypothetical protein
VASLEARAVGSRLGALDPAGVGQNRAATQNDCKPWGGLERAHGADRSRPQ